MGLGDKVKLIRKELNLTQDKFSQKLGITRGYLSDIERGKIKGTVELLNKLSNISGKSMLYFAGDDFTVPSYHILDATIDLMINNNEISQDGVASEWAEKMLMEVLRKEIQNKLCNMKKVKDQ